MGRRDLSQEPSPEPNRPPGRGVTAATTDVRTALARLAEPAPHLRWRLARADEPLGDDELACVDLAADPDALAAAVAATATGRGSDDPQVLASLWWQAYAYRVGGTALACWLLSGVAPDPRADGTAVGVARSRPSSVVYPEAGTPDAGPGSPADGPAGRDLATLVDRLFPGHLDRVAASLRTRHALGRSLIWGNVAAAYAAAAGAVRTAAGPGWRGRLDAFLAAAPTTWRRSAAGRSRPAPPTPPPSHPPPATTPRTAARRAACGGRRPPRPAPCAPTAPSPAPRSRPPPHDPLPQQRRHRAAGAAARSSTGCPTGSRPVRAANPASARRRPRPRRRQRRGRPPAGRPDRLGAGLRRAARRLPRRRRPARRRGRRGRARRRAGAACRPCPPASPRGPSLPGAGRAAPTSSTCCASSPTRCCWTGSASTRPGRCRSPRCGTVPASAPRAPVRDPERPLVGVVFYRAHLVAGNTQFVADLCAGDRGRRRRRAAGVLLLAAARRRRAGRGPGAAAAATGSTRW